MGRNAGIAKLGMMLVWLTGCASTIGGESGEPIELHEMGSKVADVLCQGLEPCCRVAGVSFDVEDCWREVTASVNDQLRFDPKRVGYDAEAAGECLEQARASASCDEIAKVVRLVPSGQLAVARALPASCQEVFVGKVPLGGRCDVGLECEPLADGSEVVCAFDSAGSAACQREQALVEDVVAGALGDACQGSCSTLEACPNYASSDERRVTVCLEDDGLGCYNGKCESLPRLGEACEYVGLACTGGSYCEVGMCAAQREDGESCFGGKECLTGQCNEDGVCGARDPIAYACERIPN